MHAAPGRPGRIEQRFRGGVLALRWENNPNVAWSSVPLLSYEVQLQRLADSANGNQQQVMVHSVDGSQVSADGHALLLIGAGGYPVDGTCSVQVRGVNSLGSGPLSVALEFPCPSSNSSAAALDAVECLRVGSRICSSKALS